MNVIYHRMYVPLSILWRMAWESTNCSGRNLMFLRKIWNLLYCVLAAHTTLQLLRSHTWTLWTETDFPNTSIFYSSCLSSHCKPCHLVNTAFEQCSTGHTSYTHWFLLLWFTTHDWEPISYATFTEMNIMSYHSYVHSDLILSYALGCETYLNALQYNCHEIGYGRWMTFWWEKSLVINFLTLHTSCIMRVFTPTFITVSNPQITTTFFHWTCYKLLQLAIHKCTVQ